MQRTPNIIDLGDNVRMIDWPAFTYIERTDDAPISLDHMMTLDKPTLAVPFKSLRGDEIHHHFGIGEDDGRLFAYGLPVSLTAHARAKETIVAQRLDRKVVWKGDLYVIRQTANQNIKFVKLETA